VFENKSGRQASARPAVVQRRGVERVHAILDAAETLLAEQGCAAATLKAIGEQAGIPTASLYHYFADRSQVDAELVRRQVRARRALGRGTEPPPRAHPGRQHRRDDRPAIRLLP